MMLFFSPLSLLVQVDILHCLNSVNPRLIQEESCCVLSSKSNHQQGLYLNSVDADIMVGEAVLLAIFLRYLLFSP